MNTKPAPTEPAPVTWSQPPRSYRMKSLASVLLLAALPAFAAAPLSFEEVDTDGDGLVSADEAANVAGLDFDAADTDQDGTLSIDEYEIAVGKWALPHAVSPALDLDDEEPAPAAVQKPADAAQLPTAPKAEEAKTDAAAPSVVPVAPKAESQAPKTLEPPATPTSEPKPAPASQIQRSSAVNSTTNH